MTNAVRFLLLVALASASLIAQKPGGGNPGGNTPPSTAPNPGIGRQPSPTTLPPQENGNVEPQVPIFLSGKVVMDDGSVPPPNIPIQRVCNNNPRTMTWTDSKGHFSFQWGQTLGVIGDASEPGYSNDSSNPFNSTPLSRSGGFGNSGLNTSMMGCELRANAAGFRSETVNLMNRRAMDNPDVGMIVLHRIANVEGTSISATSFNAPKDAQKAYQKGLQSLGKSKPDDAAKEFERAVALYPRYANAWIDLGRTRLQQHSVEPAREAFLKAIEADGKLVDAYAQLGMLAAQQQNWSDAVHYVDQALHLDPVDYPQLWFVDAVANYNVKNLDVAEKSAREAQKLDSGHRNPRTDQLLGLILVQKQDAAGAAEAFRSYLKFAPNAPDLDQIKAQLAQLDAAQTPK